MGRRLTMIIGFALVVACGVRLVLAQQSNPSSSLPSLNPAGPATPEATTPSQTIASNDVLSVRTPPLSLGRADPTGPSRLSQHWKPIRRYRIRLPPRRWVFLRTFLLALQAESG